MGGNRKRRAKLLEKNYKVFGFHFLLKLANMLKQNSAFLNVAVH